jgi:hypothetical protein
MAATRLRKARALRAFSATQCPAAAALRITPSGSTVLQRHFGVVPRSSVLGTSTRRAAHRPSWSAAGRCRLRAAARRCGSAAGRPGPWGRRCRSPPAARCPASRTWRCRRSRRAVRCAGSARSRRPSAFAEAAPPPAPAGLWLSKPVSAHHRHRGVEDDAAAAHQPQLRHGAFVVPGLPMAWPSRSADLVGADHHGVRVQRSHGRALASARRCASCGRALAGQRGLVDPGATTSNGRRRRQQFAPVARGGGQDERRARGPQRSVLTESAAILIHLGWPTRRRACSPPRLLIGHRRARTLAAWMRCAPECAFRTLGGAARAAVDMLAAGCRWPSAAACPAGELARPVFAAAGNHASARAGRREHCCRCAGRQSGVGRRGHGRPAGEQLAAGGRRAQPEPWLHLRAAQPACTLECQRCLQPMAVRWW